MTTSKKNMIVIVDDDEDLLRLLTAAFIAKGFEVKTMTTGKEGLSFFSDEKKWSGAALIILDRMLPDMDGLDILRKFTAKFSHKVPVLILSVLTSEKDVLSGLQKGAVDYIGKPFSLPILMEKALALIGK
ncbi:MAG: response regulator transcription factor [Simkania sp.]|nr:response regulator transcription factor [Simkania sp.]